MARAALIPTGAVLSPAELRIAQAQALAHPHSQALSRLGHRSSGPLLVALQRGSRRHGAATGEALETRRHNHPQGQLICIDDGLLRIHTDTTAWLLHPQRAIWIPPHVWHRVSARGVTTSWNVFVAPQAASALPREACVMGLSELAMALICRASAWTWQSRLSPPQRRVIAVLLDELRLTQPDELHLPMPTDRRLLRIAHAMLESPEHQRTLEEWAAWAGMSARTVNRLLDEELGTSFARWRRDVILLHALRRLRRGESVSLVADALGYSSPSNFITMFRRVYGESPARYLARARDRDDEPAGTGL